jgi:hypothetical protein
MRRGTEPSAYLSIENIDCSVPFLLQNMVLHDLLEIAYDSCIVKEDIRSAMTQY